MTEPQHVNARTGGATRGISASGFLLALLLFLLLPCVAVSCDAPAMGNASPGTVDVTYTGAQLVTGEPGAEGTGSLALSEAQTEESEQRVAKLYGLPRILAPATAAVLGIGLLTALLRRVRVRTIVAASAAVAGIALLTSTLLVTRSALISLIRTDIVPLTTYLPGVEGMDLHARTPEVVHPRIGFWLALAALAVTLTVNIVALVRSGPRSPTRPPARQNADDPPL